MDNLRKALESAIANKNWYAALFIALSIPDICGYLEYPTAKSQERYERWFGKHMLNKYSSFDNLNKSVYTFLSPSDCYALRCVLLHQGSDNITEQSARDTLDRFHFIEPPPNAVIHLNQINNILQLQVDIFCKDILNGLAKWIIDTQGNTDIDQRMNTVLKVHLSNQIPGFLVDK